MSVQTCRGTPGHSASAVSINLHEQLRCLACAACGIEIWAQPLCKRRNVQLSFILQVSVVKPSEVCCPAEHHSQQSLYHRRSADARIPIGKHSTWEEPTSKISFISCSCSMSEFILWRFCSVIELCPAVNHICPGPLNHICGPEGVPTVFKLAVGVRGTRL